jgi:transposase
MEQAGHQPRLAHALTAKRRMQGRHKTNEKDARGLAMLLRNGTLPDVWIPPAALRDQRELLRWRMFLSQTRARMKNRIHAVLQRYNRTVDYADLFGDAGRAELLSRLGDLPLNSRESIVEQLQVVGQLGTQIGACEEKLEERLYPSAEHELVDSLPCVGKILSAVIALEIGDIRRFPEAEDLVSYAGLVPAARESADWKKKDRCPRDCNVYLKWAYVEAGNLISIHGTKWAHRHGAQLYERVKQNRKMHGKATVAVARPLAEATYWMLTKQEIYREPQSQRPVLSSTPRVSAAAPWPLRPISECDTRRAESKIMPK